MAEEEKDQKKVTQESPKKKFPVLVVVIALCVILVAGGAVGAYFMFFASKKKGEGDHASAEVKQEQVQKKGEAGDAHGGGPGGEGGGSGSVKPLDPFIVNLADAQGQRYLKAVMQIETDNPSADSEINAKLPQIRDEILMILSNKTFDDVSTVAGKRMLKREIASAVNRYLSSGQVTNVFFTEFVVQ
ncbi:MAG TPA: flagellar basal body-associated FliL family protein [Deltaproteobacteria bacterium]|nr:flagellar basal body-associated FliL family protein [Deltaproteobacteria bacterium]